PFSRTKFAQATGCRRSRERSSRKRQDVAVLANEVRASDRMSPFSRTKFAQATGCRRSRERSSRKRQEVAAQAHRRGMLMRARHGRSDNRPMSAELTAHSRKTRAAALSVSSNAALIVLKLVAAGVTGSIALLTDAVHSSIDLLASFIALFAIRKADQPADDSHPYGHEKAEN